MAEQTIIGLLDPSIDSDNMGDHIIQDAVRRELSEIFPAYDVVSLPTQRLMTRAERRRAKSCRHFFVGGTNILNGNIPFYMQWKMDPEIVALLMGRTSTIGVGWWKYQDRTNLLSAKIWKTLFRGSPISVRDFYTKQKLDEIGIEATNTSCPTLWTLPESVNVATEVSDSVVVTLTDYKRDVTADLALFESLRSIYETVYIWPQGEKDATYIEKMRLDVRIGSREVSWFDEIVKSGADYVGTRLHAGIRAHQLGAHSIIVAIDNRAIEIHSDTGLPIIERECVSDYGDAFTRRRPVELTLPASDILCWKQQIAELLDAD